MNMNIPEYLLLFNNEGNYKIKLKHSNRKVPVVEKQMDILDIHKLINPETNDFYNQITVDEYKYTIKKIDINILKKEFVISVAEE